VEQEALLIFEERNGISLPSDYRDFVLKIGNGGAGPYYGIYPLLLDHNIDHRMKGNNRIDLSKPFPHSREWDPDWLHGIDWEAGERPDDELTADYFDTAHISGAVCICHYGCGDFLLLVVNGSEKGNIWVDGRTNFSGIFRGGLEEGEGLVTFGGWYVNWLDRSLAELGSKEPMIGRSK
jgi:hypothetical protein